MSKYQSIRCACGAVLDRRNVRASGMAVCRCGNNYTAQQFELVRELGEETWILNDSFELVRELGEETWILNDSFELVRGQRPRVRPRSE